MSTADPQVWHGPLRLTVALLVLLSLAGDASAAYDKAFCEKYADGEEMALQSPYFREDYSLLSERTVHFGENDTHEYVSHQKLLFSKINGQVMARDESPYRNMRLLVDEVLSYCSFISQTGYCQQGYNVCRSTTYPLSFVTMGNGSVHIGTGSGSFHWPTNQDDVKKTVSMGRTRPRGIECKKYAACTYDAHTDRTTVTEWHVLDPEKYVRLDQTRPIVMAVYQRGRRQGRTERDVRTDYADYKRLSPYQLQHGLHIGEGSCGGEKRQYSDKSIPTPPRRHSFQELTLVADSEQHNAFRTEIKFEEYNYLAKLRTVAHYNSVNDQNEEESIVTVFDFRADHMYSLSATKTSCRVYNLFRTHGQGMQTPEEYWHLNAPQSSYLGVFVARDIPCDTWRFDYPDGKDGVPKGGSVFLYLATAEWLRTTGRSATEFFPVLMIRRWDQVEFFHHYFEFNTNPGYHIPDLPICFKREDTVVGVATLETNYYRKIAHDDVHFAYEFRSLLKKVTGIKSSMRIGEIAALASPDSPEETLVTFTIYGQFVNVNSSQTKFYEKDPVSSSQAAAAVNTMVDQGTVQFRLGAQESVSINFKKGSFMELESSGHFRYMDRPAQRGVSPAGYSSGAMAGVGITVLLVGMALATGAILFYKRWTEGEGSGLTFGMRSMNDDA